MTESLFTTPAMAATFAPAAHVRAMLAFEAALARAQAGATLLQPALAEPQVTAALRPEAIAVAPNPAAYLGSADAWIDRAPEAFNRLLLRFLG